jgi:uncharacterized membrane protein
MEIRTENHRPASESTLKDLTPGVAALLCYVGGWISGIVFLVLEQKNRFVRFHALQSIIVFGSLTLIGAVLGSIPLVGDGFQWAVFVVAFILWIILMVKAVGGEYFQLPWAGNLADRLANESLGKSAQQPAGNDNTGANTAPPTALPTALLASSPVSSPVDRNVKRDTFRDRYYSWGARAGRITGSAFAIAWSVVLLIFFNFYSQYIASYQPIQSGNTDQWQILTLITSSYYVWLPLLTATLVLSIVGHAILIAFDRYILRQIVRIILDVLGIATIISLLVIFPFNFNVIPDPNVAFWVPFALTMTLLFIAVGIGIGAVVRFIQLIVHMAEGRY